MLWNRRRFRLPLRRFQGVPIVACSLALRLSRLGRTSHLSAPLSITLVSSEPPGPISRFGGTRSPQEGSAQTFCSDLRPSKGARKLTHNEKQGLIVSPRGGGLQGAAVGIAPCRSLGCLLLLVSSRATVASERWTTYHGLGWDGSGRPLGASL